MQHKFAVKTPAVHITPRICLPLHASCTAPCVMLVHYGAFCINADMHSDCWLCLLAASLTQCCRSGVVTTMPSVC